MMMGGSWSAYWYNGVIVSSEIARGMDIYELLPSGLITENASDTRNRVPLLGDLPVVGWLFGQTSTGKVREELLVLITPTVFTPFVVAKCFTPARIWS